MAFDKSTRNRLARFVAEARGLIAEEFTQQFQSLYGISPEGVCTPIEKLTHLDETQLATAALLRGRIDYLVKTHPDDRDGTKAAVARLAREQAFTILNRFAAIRMAEKRGLIVESIGKGYQSKGFKVYETVTGNGLGEAYQRYRLFLFCLFDEFAVDLGVLFDRHSPQALLFPREQALLALLELINHSEIEPLWAEDETIGWIYQYYNDPEERKKMRAESAAPRNSRELAVRNQFFTPRYVVEFLTDNTLGRIWYEMTRGQTRLAEQCRYLVRRPTEIFLAEGETAPETLDQEGLSQEELLKQPVHIPHRPLKDPREIRLLDPACGSMHFGLYAFDLFETIYEEAWELLERMKAEGKSRKEMEAAYPEFSSFILLTSAFFSKEEFLRELPRLIIEHNIHGIDIDPRAVQIAGLSLWLRAQKSWQQQKVPAADRPCVRRSNIVCAEPMPGSPEMLEEFVATLKPDLLGELVKTVFDKMQLAGEAGSLLKIEEEIRTAINTARKEWLKQQDDLLTRKDGSQEEFFNTAEQQVNDALRAYAEQADVDSYQRRLFADDAARGFAFIDLCRREYDVALMNPPFGSFPSQWTKQAKASYPSSSNDILGAFVERGVALLSKKGRLGAITSRTAFFLSSFRKWREEVILKSAPPTVFADIGYGVMDGALVEAAAYCLEKDGAENGSSAATFLRVLDELEDKNAALLSSLGVTEPSENGQRYEVPSQSFPSVPGSPFAYWISNRIRDIYATLPTFTEQGCSAKMGLTTNSDFRFLRLSWETNPTDKEVRAFAKGGAYSPFYADVYLRIRWNDDGKELKAFALTTPGTTHWSRNIRSPDFYLKPGLTWSRRTKTELSMRALPANCIFSDKGPAAFVANDDPERLLVTLAFVSSKVFRSLLAVQLAAADAKAGGAARSYEVGLIQQTPLPGFDGPNRSQLHHLALGAWKAKRSLDSAENSQAFYLPAIVQLIERSLAECVAEIGTTRTDSESRLLQLQGQIDEMCFQEYGVSQRDRESIDANQGLPSLSAVSLDDSETDDEEAEISDDALGHREAASLVSWLFGTDFGRWDIHYATGERQPPELPDPFDPLPVCPPGMLQNAEGLPAEPKDVPADYPLRISWPGILVDDENHPEDIVARVREAIEVIWKDRAEAIEQEACGILGVKTLRDYLRRPAAFFADHLKRYSKSRRQAPIYWPLSTKSGSYTLWLYYHRLTDQTLHTCLADFLDPKLRKVQSELDALTGSGGGGTRAGELREFLDELRDLRDEIQLVIKLPWKPNLNDGVLITASPLHKLFRLPKWQKDLKACWDKLAKGEYDWAHLAYTIWPSRVEKACEKDRSIAIAHGREDLCKVQPPKPKKKRGKKAAAEEETEEDESELIEED